MFHAEQAPGDLLDWSLDYRPWLNGATATSSSWTVTPAVGMTLANPTLVDGVATIFVSSDQPGQIFVVKNTITTPTDIVSESVEFYISG